MYKDDVKVKVEYTIHDDEYGDTPMIEIKVEDQVVQFNSRFIDEKSKDWVKMILSKAFRKIYAAGYSRAKKDARMAHKAFMESLEYHN
jgi:hypothetical protein